MSVKRWNYFGKLALYKGGVCCEIRQHPFLSSLSEQVVLASDYDALAAETSAYVDKLVAERHDLEMRVEVLESGLRPGCECGMIIESSGDALKWVMREARAALGTAAEIEGEPRWRELAPDELPCANCGQSIDKHFGPGLPCPESDRGEKR